MSKKCLITGVTGQDGSYLAELLLSKDYIVYGVKRRSSTNNCENIADIIDHPNLKLVEGDVTDCGFMTELIRDGQFDETYSLAAQSVTSDCLCPILTNVGVDHIPLSQLWDNHISRNKIIRTEQVGDIQVEVIDLSNNTQTKALGEWNGMGTWFPIRQISRHKYKGKVAKLTQKFGSVTVTPNHSLIDVKHNLCQPKDNPWMLNIRKLNYQPSKYQKSIQLNYSSRKIDKDNYIYLHQNGNLGKIKQTLSGKDLESFCRFIAAFVAEGHTTYNKNNKSYYIGISQNDKKWLQQLENDIKNFYTGTICYVEHKKTDYDSTWEIQLRSRILFKLLRKICGIKSNTKCLPSWCFSLHPDLQKIIFDKMIEGDGCRTHNNQWRYTTVSYKLACQLSFLITQLGYDYSVCKTNAKDNHGNFDEWSFRECKSYQYTQGEEGKKIEWLDYDGWVYDISVDEVHNFTVGVGNIVVHNSHVGTSFQIPEYTTLSIYNSTLYILEAVRKYSKQTKFYFAGSSEMFGKNYSSTKDGIKYQNEQTAFCPQSPYSIAKLAGYNLTRLYRDCYGLFACSGILFNHESERRGENFVTRKITKFCANIFARHNSLYNSSIPKLKLGNLNACRDWGYAKDYAEAINLILQQDQPRDLVISTGKSYSIKQFLDKCFDYINIAPEDVKKFIEIDPALYRPAEVDYLCGDSTLARSILKWEPKTDIDELIHIMIIADIKRIYGKA